MNAFRQTHLSSTCLILAAALTFQSAPVFAQDSAAAARYYQQASEAYQSGEYIRAERLLERAYQEEPDLIYQYNRILANEAAGKTEEALGILEEFRVEMLADPDMRFADIDELKGRLETSLDEERAAEEAQEAAEAEAAAELEVAEEPQAQVEEVYIEADSSPNYLGWTLLGVGAAGLGAAAAFGSTIFISELDERLSCEQQGDGGCYADYEEPQARYDDDIRVWKAHRTITWITLGVGAAAVLGGSLAFYLGGDSAGQEDELSRSTTTKLEISPLVGAGAAGGSIQLSF